MRDLFKFFCVQCSVSDGQYCRKWLNVLKRQTLYKEFRNRYLFPAIITLYNCSKPKWRMIENMNCKINLLEIVCRIQTFWYWTDLVLRGVNLILKQHNLKNTLQNWPLRRSRFYFMCILHHLCQAPRKRTQPPLLDVTCCVRLRTPWCIFSACCWELLHPFAHHCQHGSNTITLTVFCAQLEL